MHSTDAEALTQCEHDGAAPGWAEWIGSHDGASEYLTALGMEVFEHIHADVPEFFGGDAWLAEALEGEHPVREARILSPVLTLSDPVEGFANLLRIWSLTRLAERDRRLVDGIERVRRHAKSNVSTSRFLHSLAQIELAGAGVHVGARVELEPAKAGGPGDVRLHAGQTEVFIEVATLATDQRFAEQERAFDLQQTFVRGMEMRHGVQLDGALPGHLDPDDEARWHQAVEAACLAASTGSPAEVEGGFGGGLVARRAAAGESGQRLSGPLVQIDAARRMLNMLDRKARQTASVGTAWIVLVDYNEGMRLTEFYRAPLAAKIGQLRALVDGVLGRYPHLGGIVWTHTSRAVTAPAPAAVHADEGSALLRALPGCRVRESVLIPRRIVLPHQTRLLLRLLDAEPGWIDDVLARLDYPGGLASLVRAPAPTSRALWTPASAR